MLPDRYRPDMEATERRLAAIVVADVVGFSKLMAEDEQGTLAALRAHRNVTDPVLLNHGGRIVKTTGDGMLLEFPSATAAVQAAIDVQELMQERNAALPDGRRMQFRMGINLAEVVVDHDGDVFGDGVNVAARVEAEADPGGIAITNAVREAVRGKSGAVMVDDGEHALKNMPDPVKLWKVVIGAVSPPTAGGSSPRLIGVVAVLPFDNMSGDTEQDYFADGITEDLITALSYTHYLGVVARNSTYAYRSSGKDIRAIARELDATHVVEGSVRRAGDRVRVTAQLIDAETGRHVWAERYDRELADIFELQDEIVDSIAARLRPAVFDAAAGRSASKGKRSVGAWELYLQGMHEYNKHTLDGFVKSLELFNRSRDLDEDFVAPVAASAGSWMMLAINGWRSEGVDPWQNGFAALQDAYARDSGDAGVLATMAAACAVRGDIELGLRSARRSIEINPQGFFGHHMLGAVFNAAGLPAQAIEPLTDAWRYGRHEPFRYDIANDLAWSHYMLRNYDAALLWGRQALDVNPHYLQSHLALAATLGQLGRLFEAQPHVAVIQEARPDFTASRYRTRILYAGDDHKDEIVAGLVKAGLTE